MGKEIDLRLRPLTERDEREFRVAHAELTEDGFQFGIDFDAEDWSAYLHRLQDERIGKVDKPWVAATFLVAQIKETIVGRISIRHELTDYLAARGGHIGYAVRPAYRRRGYATEILRQGVVIARSLGVDPILLTCDDDNTASAAVIEACGGVLDPLWPTSDEEPVKRRYWIS